MTVCGARTACGTWTARGQPRLLRPRHFSEVRGRPVQFRDYLLPFLQRFAAAIRAVDADAILFLEAPPRPAAAELGQSSRSRVVYAAHWYDGTTVFFRRFCPSWAFDF